MFWHYFFIFLCILFVSCSGTAVPGNVTSKFRREILNGNWTGDYGLRLCDVDGDGRMDIVAFGWASGKLAWFQNSKNGWNEFVIGEFPGIVDVDFMDLNGDAAVDFVIAWDLNIPPKSKNEGQIGWLTNQLTTPGPWKYLPIADETNFVPGVHRVRIGKFYKGFVGVVGIPIFDYGASGIYYNQTVSSFRYFPMPKDPSKTSAPWTKGSAVVSNSLHICHTIRKV